MPDFDDLDPRFEGPLFSEGSDPDPDETPDDNEEPPDDNC